MANWTRNHKKLHVRSGFEQKFYGKSRFLVWRALL